MGKFKNDQRGFSPLEVVLVLVIVALVGVVGYMVYKNHHKTTAVSTATTAKPTTPVKAITPNPYAGWQTYSDASVSLRYPDGWTVKDLSQGSGQQWTQITSAEDPSIDINTGGSGVASHQRLVIDIKPLSSATATTCSETCKIYDAVTLSTAKTTGAKLVISDWGSQGYAQELEVVDGGNGTIGAQTYDLGATVGGKSLRIYGGVNYGTNSSSGWITDVPSFEKTQAFQNLVKVINSITVK